ncbi:MAG: hypothetical protein EOO42_10370 [Flavobacteriales bacterium]|nr:MAG: hypothetical protein EOO42_10370 [Flavobacteriales bacterium]
MKIFTLLFILLLSNSISYSQVPKNAPLFQSLQKNADSTIVLEFVTGWIQKPSLKILSKKGDTISLYAYGDNRKSIKAGLTPKSIRDSIFEKNKNSIFSAPVAINVFFNSIYLREDSLRFFWNRTEKLKPWQITDDSMDGEGCKIRDANGNAKNIYDGGGYKLILITKTKIEHFYFYAPEFYEKICPGREGRQKIMEISNLFSRYFKP